MADEEFANEFCIPLIPVLAVVARPSRPEDFRHIGRQSLSSEDDELQMRRFRPSKIEALFPGSSG
jgi:hypothetical protein